MNLNTKGKGELVADECSNTIVLVIGSGFVYASWNERKVTLVVFYDNLSMKTITIGADATGIGLSNDNDITNLKKNQLLHQVDSLLLSAPHACEFVVDVHDFANPHGGK